MTCPNCQREIADHSNFCYSCGAKQPATGDLVLSGATIHLLDNVHQAVSATAIREAVVAKKPLRKFVDAAVEEYIKKEGLYLG